MLPDVWKPTIIIAAVLCLLIVGGFAILFTLRSRSRSLEQQTAFYLQKHQDYFQYLSINIDSPAPLLPPPGKLKAKELKALQQKLLEWIEMLDGSHRDKLSELCSHMGLVELELKRLHSTRHWERIDAAYHLGVMRAKACAGELLSLLEQETDESTAFVIGRATAKCTQQPGELRKLALRLVKHHPHSHHLILDIIGSSSLDPVPLYLEMLQAPDEDLITLALLGLSGHNEPEAIPILDTLVHAEQKEVRIKACKLLLQYTHVLQPEQLIAFMHHPDWEIRAAAVKIAGEQPNGNFIDTLKDTLSDSNWWVRHHSAKSLTHLGVHGFQALCEVFLEAQDAQDQEDLIHDIARDAVHEQLETAAALASQDIKQLLLFNELSHLYEKILNQSYVSHTVKQLRVPS
jgi:HEAT repeat protein